MATMRENWPEHLVKDCESSQMYAQLLDRVQECVVMMDLAGRIIYVNSAAASLINRGKEELVGRYITSLKESTSGGAFEQEMLDRTLSCGEWRGEVPLTRCDYHDILLDCRTSLIRDMYGQAIAVLGISSDISHLRRTADRLEEYQEVVENLNKIILVVDREYRLLVANRAFLKHRRLLRGQVLGHPLWEILREGFDLGITRGDVDQCFAGDSIVIKEVRCRFPDEGVRDVLITYLPIPGHASTDRVACVVQDITEWKVTTAELNRHRQHLEELIEERTAELGLAVEALSLEVSVRMEIEKKLRESENFYRTVFENTGTGMFVTEADTSITLANQQYAKLLGLSPDKTENLCNLTETIVEEERKRIDAYHVMRRIDPASVPSQYETRIKDRQGRIKDVLVTVAMIPGTQRSVASLIDITRRKQAERELEQSNAELTTLQRSTRNLLELESLHSVMNSIAKGVVEGIGYDVVLVARFVDEGKNLTGFVIHPPEQKELMGALFAKGSQWPLWESQLRYIPGHNRNFDRVVKGETLIDASLSAFVTQWAPEAYAVAIQKQTGRVGYICQPMRVKDETVGVIFAGWSDAKGKLERMHCALGRIADQAAVAVKSSALFECVENQRIELKSLAGRLQMAQESERKKIAQELHDRVGQNLTGLSLNLAIIRNLLPSTVESQVLERISDALALVGDTMGCIRDVMSELHPPALADCGLGPALKIHCELLAKRTGMNIRMMPTDITFLAHRETEIALFRIAQEALNNSIRHSKATNVTVKLVSDRTRWVLSVIDDGVGIPHGRRLAQATPGKSFGLISMRERAEAAGGRLRVISAPGQGTQIVVAWLKEGV